MKQSEAIDADFHGSSQSEIELVSSISQPTNYSSMIEIYSEDASLSDTFSRLPFAERKVSFSWPSSPQLNAELTDCASLDDGMKYKVPFLLRMHSGHFHIYLGLCSQTVLWKTLQGDSISYIPIHFTLGLWLLALASYLVIGGAYLLKCLFYFEIVRKEYNDRVRVNYFFVPSIAGMLLRMGLPSHIAPDKVHPVLCCIFMAPITVLELKIYGQWFTKGKRSLARIANPSTYLSVIGNFVVARLATRVEWREAALLFFTVGLVHYAVVFVTLYQRLCSDITVSRKIWPVFFLFIAAPSSASVAWEAISGSFDTGCKMLLFLSLFLYLALIMRLIFFRENMGNFSVIWWACAYPMTTTSVAAVKYAEEVKHPIALSLALVACFASIGMVLLLLLLTGANMVVARDRLFPNDTVIIISAEDHIQVSVGVAAKRCSVSCSFNSLTHCKIPRFH